MSLTQHYSESNSGVLHDHEYITRDGAPRAKTIKPLPESYTLVKSAAYPKENPLPSSSVSPLVPGDTLLSSDTAQFTWLDKKIELLKEESHGTNNVMWSARFADLQDPTCMPAITGLLALF